MLKVLKLESNSIEFVGFTSKELSAICPVNTRPDFYNLEINFSPREQTIEVSTLRKYLLGFRERSIYAEDLAEEICSNLYGALKPNYLSIKLKNRPENGIGIEVFARKGWEKE